MAPEQAILDFLRWAIQLSEVELLVTMYTMPIVGLAVAVGFGKLCNMLVGR